MEEDKFYLARSSGVLLHPTSFPDSPVCGTFGKPAREWLRFLSQNGIGVWQFLPLSLTDGIGSPYSSPSSFSLNPWFLDVDDLVRDGFLPKNANDILPGSKEINNDFIDFDLANFRSKRVAKLLVSHWNFQNNESKEEFDNWKLRQSWLISHAKFMFLREKNEFKPWWKWEKRYTNLIESVNLSEQNNYLLEYFLVQWHLDRQWTCLKILANKLGVKLYGDMPFYVSRDSVDVWSNKSLFSINETGRVFTQSGVPPDYFSETGQLWGTPVYRWRKHKITKFKWWRERVKRHFNLVDLLRVDHFRALDSFWAVSGSDLTAKNGYWSSSPGLKMLNLFKKDNKGNLPIIAEDLGVITQNVERLRDHFFLPGMKILQFAFDGNNNNPYLPENIEGNNWVVYTGTHDNSTTLSWWNNLNEETKSLISKRFNKNYFESPSWNFIEMGLSSNAKLFISPLQDLMGLDDRSRLNKPGTITNNWKWRLKKYDKNFKDSIKAYGERSSFWDR